jgi:hypothetical protein
MRRSSTTRVLHSAFWIEHRLWGDCGARLPPAERPPARASCCLLAPGPSPALVGAPSTSRPARMAGDPRLPCIRCASSRSPGSPSRRTRSPSYSTSSREWRTWALTPGPARRRRSYVLAFLLFIAALLTKSVTATLPAALLVVLWWKRRRFSWRRDAWPLCSPGSRRDRGRALHGLGRAQADRRRGRRVRAQPRSSAACWPAARHLVLPGQARSGPPGLLSTRAGMSPLRGSGWAGYLAAAALVTAALWLLRGGSRGPSPAGSSSSARSFPASASSTSIPSSSPTWPTTSSTWRASGSSRPRLHPGPWRSPAHPLGFEGSGLLLFGGWRSAHWVSYSARQSRLYVTTRRSSARRSPGAPIAGWRTISWAFNLAMAGGARSRGGHRRVRARPCASIRTIPTPTSASGSSWPGCPAEAGGDRAL